ncbi:LapA family protein [bacterium]|nr:LapA family protein [bacterium]
MQVKFIIVVIFLLLGGWFLAQNSQMVQIKFFLWGPGEISLLVLVVFSFLSGVVLSLFISLVDQVKLRRTIKQQKKEIRELKEKSDLSEHISEQRLTTEITEN